MKALKIAGAALAVLIVAAAALLVIGIPSGLVTSAIQARIERETGYRIAIAGATRLGFWPSLNVTVHDVTLSDPADREVSDRLKIGGVEATIPLRSLLTGDMQISELTIDRPVLRVPLLRERSKRIDNSTRSTSSSSSGAKSLPVFHLTITDGTIAFTNPRDRVEDRIDGIDAEARSGADRQIDVAGSARLGEHPLKFAIRATAPAVLADRQNIPVELTVDAPDLLRQSLSGKAEARLNGSVLMINGLSGTFGDSQFNGWASADFASKPFVKVDLDFQRLDFGTPSRGKSQQLSRQVSQEPWSDAKIDVSGLNYVDAQLRISAAELGIGDARFAPVAVDATLGSGMLKATFSHFGVYGGQADGELGIDATGSIPAFALRADLNGVQALPLLSSAADFDKLDGKMQAKIAVGASGESQRAIISNLGGSVSTSFQDGAIRGINVAKMIRSLTSGTLSGWQDGKDQTTDLSQLSASFQIERGQATTRDLVLVGPLVRMSGAGTVDLANKSMGFRVEPKLVMTIEGQGGAANPVGLGIPVIVRGPWSAPDIYPDMAGILDNPDAAYAKLREMGTGLFGNRADGSRAPDQLGATLGTLIQQGLGAAAKPPKAPPDDAECPESTCGTATNWRR